MLEWKMRAVRILFQHAVLSLILELTHCSYAGSTNVLERAFNSGPLPGTTPPPVGTGPSPVLSPVPGRMLVVSFHRMRLHDPAVAARMGPLIHALRRASLALSTTIYRPSSFLYAHGTEDNRR